MSAFKSGCNEFLPDKREIIEMCTKQINALPARNFCIQLIFLGHLANNNQFVRRNLPTWDTGNNRVGTTFLYIGQVPVITILRHIISLAQDHLIPETGQQ
ncbi:hypothetical protein D3C76_1619150 [compost metagenome]